MPVYKPSTLANNFISTRKYFEFFSLIKIVVC